MIDLIDSSIKLMMMALSSLQLEAFMAVTRTLSFTKAAASLHITQSALSQRILNLEQELETALFIRDRAGLKLTEAAENLVRYCQFKDQVEEEFLTDLRGSQSSGLAGVIRIGGFSSVVRSLLLPALGELQNRNRSLRLQVLTGEMYELPELLKRTEVDYLLLDRDLEREEIECLLLGYEENVLVQKKNYKGADIYLDHDENDLTTLSYLKKFEKTTKKVQRQYLDDIYGIIDAAKLGVGKAVLPLHLIEKEDRLEVINKHVMKVPIYLCYYKQPYYTKLHLALVASIQEHFKKCISQRL